MFPCSFQQARWSVNSDNKHLFRSPGRLHPQGYRFNFMSLQVMYSSHHQPSFNINEHTTPKTVTIFAVQAKSFDVKVGSGNEWSTLHSLITIMSKRLLRIRDLSSKNLKPTTLLTLICPIFRFLEYFIRIVDNSSSLSCTSLDDLSDKKVKALDSLKFIRLLWVVITPSVTSESTGR